MLKFKSHSQEVIPNGTCLLLWLLPASSLLDQIELLIQLLTNAHSAIKKNSQKTTNTLRVPLEDVIAIIKYCKLGQHLDQRVSGH